ncbi:histidinol dehydrogenase [Candidatus Sumerlaeota bacterium]|nr:histidinol dehydrogenase [Candidatus Sumerlaeota bacterium]
MTTNVLTVYTAEEVAALVVDPVDSRILPAVDRIVTDVRVGGDAALLAYAKQFAEVADGAPIILPRAELKATFESIRKQDQELLVRVADRIRSFAEAQRDALKPITHAIPGGEAGHTIAPVEVAGCYAPGGKFPLPSSVLMTAVTARAAGVRTVVVASPKPTPITLAAAHVAGADLFLSCGGAHAIAAMAFGTQSVPRADVVVGPGNPWTTAAKKIVSGYVAIDMLAGPSELLVYADETASPAIIAADLLAQAEHGADSVPVLVSMSRKLINAVNAEIASQLSTLPTFATANAAIAHGYAVLVKDEAEAIRVIDKSAPEHLELLCANADELAKKINHYGAVFIGSGAAEVLGDYGAGPNHTLPTGGTARFTGGLSVFHFLRVRTWMRVNDLHAAKQLVADARDLGRHEGLEGHARAAEARLN